MFFTDSGKNVSVVPRIQIKDYGTTKDILIRSRFKENKEGTGLSADINLFLIILYPTEVFFFFFKAMVQKGCVLPQTRKIKVTCCSVIQLKERAKY